MEQELRACDQVLGDPETTRRFLLDAAQRLGFDLKPTDPPGIFQVAYPAGDGVPWILQDEISRLPSQRITFEPPRRGPPSMSAATTPSSPPPPAGFSSPLSRIPSMPSPPDAASSGPGPFRA